jgi:hypothetical protein
MRLTNPASQSISPGLVPFRQLSTASRFICTATALQKYSDYAESNSRYV